MFIAGIIVGGKWSGITGWRSGGGLSRSRGIGITLEARSCAPLSPLACRLKGGACLDVRRMIAMMVILMKILTDNV